MDKIVKAIRIIEKQVKPYAKPSVTRISGRKDPFQVLVSCILSLRTKDKTTTEAAERLFRVAACPADLIKLSSGRLEKIIYPVGFYRNKAKVILDISRKIIKMYGGEVPRRLEGLMAFKGVGPKTANLVLGLGFHIPAICVDTHVHRISNRMGWVKTRSPEQTEDALKSVLAEREWIAINTTLVTFGQNLCLPVSPFCSKCLVYKYCPRKGVVRSR
ncbi:MAG: endonuclease III [Candidatus Omnitrophota bacterium]